MRVLTDNVLNSYEGNPDLQRRFYNGFTRSAGELYERQQKIVNYYWRYWLFHPFSLREHMGTQVGTAARPKLKFGNHPLINHKLFTAPNETKFLKFEAIVAQAPAGVAVVIGTERGLFVLPFNDRLSGLVLADHDPRAVYYNEVNLELIRASKDASTYRGLRYGKDFKRFVELLKRSNYEPTDPALDLAKDRRHFDWIQYAENRSEGLAQGQGDFAKSYVHDDAAFERVKAMVDDGRVVTRLIDIADAGDRERLTAELRKAGQRIALYDPSNAWWNQYTGMENRAFIPAADVFAPNGIVMVTDRHIDDRGMSSEWVYMGFKREDLDAMEQRDPRLLEGLFDRKHTDSFLFGSGPNNLSIIDSLDSPYKLGPEHRNQLVGTAAVEAYAQRSLRQLRDADRASSYFTCRNRRPRWYDAVTAWLPSSARA